MERVFCISNVFYHAAKLKLYHAVSQMAVTIIMADDYHCLVPALQSGNDFVIEELAKFKILIGGPFIKDIDRPVFQIGGKQRQSLFLALREVDGRELSI